VSQIERTGGETSPANEKRGKKGTAPKKNKRVGKKRKGSSNRQPNKAAYQKEKERGKKK